MIVKHLAPLAISFWIGAFLAGLTVHKLHWIGAIVAFESALLQIQATLYLLAQRLAAILYCVCLVVQRLSSSPGKAAPFYWLWHLVLPTVLFLACQVREFCTAMASGGISVTDDARAA